METVGVDVGGTKIAGSLVDVAAGRVRHLVRAGCVVDGRRDPGFVVSSDVVARVVAAARQAGADPVGVGVGVPEYVSADGTVTSAEVLDWDAQAGAALAAAADGLPVTVSSDVRCGALAEARLGAGRGVGSFLYVSAGTGLSSTLVLDGTPWAGARGEAIALGELPVHPDVAVGAGALEPFASGAAMLRRYVALAPDDVARAVVDGPGLDAAAAAGDPDARTVVESSAQALAHALHAAVSLLDPQVVVLGGGLGSSGGHWAAVLRRTFTALTARRPGAPSLEVARLGPDAGLVGAALAAVPG